MIPRPPEASVDDEVQVVMRTPGRDSPPPVVKQVIGFLAHVRHEKSERALITYLRLFENMLLQPAAAVYSLSDVEMLLDRTCTALARYGTPRSWRALVDHGLKAEPRLGSPMARLVEAGRQDLSGTPTLEVRGALQEVVDKHPGTKFAEAAAKALAGFDSAGKPAEAAGLSGDLDLFGLPNVLQTLSQSQLTGVLSLMKAPGKVEASVLLENGRFRGAQLASLRGQEAIYQLFEKPFPGTFAFISRADLGAYGPASEPLDVLGLLLEGVRRHDEFKRAAALVPEGAVLESTGAASTPLSEEDAEFIRLVWTTAAKGTTVADCEAAIQTDNYRTRRLLAHWVEEGALKVRPASS